jgi:hypothetical protein
MLSLTDNQLLEFRRIFHTLHAPINLHPTTGNTNLQHDSTPELMTMSHDLNVTTKRILPGFFASKIADDNFDIVRIKTDSGTASNIHILLPEFCLYRTCTKTAQKCQSDALIKKCNLHNNYFQLRVFACKSAVAMTNKMLKQN